MAYSLEEMEKYLSEIFAEAEKDLIKKAADYMADFAVRDMAKAQKVENGELSDEEYREWRKNKLLYGQHWTRLIQDAQKEMANVNQTALDYINDKTTKIFADSYNSLEGVIKSSAVEGYSFELVDANTVKNIAKQEGIMLPPKKNLDKQKDKLWNAKLVNAQLLQGILQGESVPKIAARMGNVCESNKAASIRNARTMVTAAENSGRQSGMNKAAKDGIIFKKIWIATADERTRPTHISLNGAMVDNDEKFVTFNGDEIEFPGDWAAKPSEVWNCRCTLGTKVTGFDKVKLDRAIERQEALEHQVEEQQTVENLQYVEDVHNIRDTFIQTAEAAERDKLIQRAGAIMGARHKEYYDRLDDIDRRWSEISAEYNTNDLFAQYRALQKEADRLSKEMYGLNTKSDEFKKAQEKWKEAERRAEEAYDAYNAKSKEKNKLLDVLRKERREVVDEMLQFRKDMLKEIRKCGTERGRTEFFTGSKAAAERFYACLADYPAEWVEALYNAGRLNCAEVNRGFYNHIQKKIRDSGSSSNSHTNYHEEGHAFEHNIPDILSAEQYFYDRRTEGEALAWLGGTYGKSEKTRKDNFLDPYMGKDYGGDAFELVSMGFESYFTNSYELKDDEDYSNFIMGVLALC